MQLYFCDFFKLIRYSTIYTQNDTLPDEGPIEKRDGRKANFHKPMELYHT